MKTWAFKELSDGQIQALATAHTRLFENRIRAGQNGTRGINIEECQRFLQIWNNVLAKAKETDCKGRLTAEEKIEVRDALLDGGYDDLLEAAATN